MSRINLIKSIISAIFIFLLPIILCATTNDYDFSLNVTPSTRTINTGDSTHYQVTIQFKSSYDKPVNMSVSGLPAGAVGSFTVNPIIRTGNGKTKLEIETSTATPCGTYTLTITGQEEGGGITHSKDVTLIIENCPDPDFTIDAVPESREITQGESTNYTVNLTALNGFDSAVNLTIAGLPAEASGLFSINPVIPTGESILTISTTTSTPVDQYTATVTGEGGGKIHSIQITLKINEKPPEPDFTIESDPFTQTVYPGESTDYKIKLTSLNAFSKRVRLSIKGLPSGTTAVFHPDKVKPTGKSELTVTTAKNTPVGTYTLTITGKGGNKQHHIDIILKIEKRPPAPDFELKVEPGSRTLHRSESTGYTVVITALNEFSGDVSLGVSGVPTGTTASFTAEIITAAGTSQLQIATTTGTPVGTYTLTITAKSGDNKHSTTVELSVICRDFSLKIKAEPEKGPAPLAVEFEAEVANNDGYSAADYHYLWNFGDGNTSSLQSPEHTFQAPGNYQVKVTVTDPCGNSKTAAKTINAEEFEGAVTKSFSVSEALPGDEIFFTIEARNDTLFDFTNIIILDELSPLLEYIGDDAPVTPIRSGQKLIWQISNLPKGETLRIQVKVKVSENAPAGTITNVAHLSHDSLGPGKRITSNTAKLTVNKIDITLLKQVEQTAAEPGDTIKYQLVVKNNSSIPITGVELTDELSRYLEFISQTGKLEFSKQGQYLQWTGTIKAQHQEVIVIKARIKHDIFSGTRIQNQARLEALELKAPIDSNTVETFISSEPISTTKVRFTKRSEVPQTEVGRIIRFNITAANMSDSTLISPVIEDYLPQGFSYVASSTLLNNQLFTEPQGNRRLLWQLPHINPGQTVVIRYQVVIGTDAKRGRNINRAVLRTTDNSGQDIFLEASAFVNVSAAGFIFYSGVEGTVYLDRDDDDFYSMPDTPLENIEVRLSTGQKAITSTNGHYSFESLFPGEYAVGVNTVTLPERYRLASPYPRVVVLSDGLFDTVDFAVKFRGEDDVKNARLEGRVFFDKIKNQAYDPGDPLLKQFKVKLSDQLLTTGSDGNFVFSHIEPGTYTVEILYDNKSVKKEVKIEKGNNQVDIPLRFSGIKIIITCEK